MPSALISLLAIVATIAVIFYAFNQGLPFVHHYTVHVLVSNSVNVRQDSPVRIAGIDVGAVTGVSPAGRSSEITFTLDDAGRPIHKNATLRIRDRLFLEGGYYLELDPGTPDAPVAPDGYTIPQAQTTSPVQFYSVLSTFNSAARTSIQNLLVTLNQGFSARSGQSQADGGAGGLKTAVPALTPVLKDTALISQGVRGTRPGDIERFLSSASEVTGTVASQENQLTGLVHDLNVTSTALVASDGSLGQTFTGLDELLQQAPGTLATTDRALPPVVHLAQALDPTLRVAPPIIEKIITSVDQLTTVTAPVERSRLLRSLQTTFTQFPQILRTLAGAFPITKSVTDCLRTHVTPILQSKVNDGNLSTGLPVWQEFVHFLPSVAGASGSFDANGYYTRVLAGAGTQSVTGTALSKLPIIGQLVGEAPGGNVLTGVSPTWVGDLPPSAFNPAANCAVQPLPNLAALSAAPDLRAVDTPRAPRTTLAQAKAMEAKGRAEITPPPGWSPSGGKP